MAALLAFATASFLSLAALPRLAVGLDQGVALPSDSYLQRYFSDIGSYLRVGPPLYLVVNGVNASAEAGQLDRLCSVAGCQHDSLTARIAQARGAVSFLFIFISLGHRRAGRRAVRCGRLAVTCDTCLLHSALCSIDTQPALPPDWSRSAVVSLWLWPTFSGWGCSIGDTWLG